MSYKLGGLKIMLPWIILALIVTICSYLYITIDRGYFDDVYIYLAMARNAVDYGTWQYYPKIIDRDALLASSPLRILVLTIGAWFAKVFGFGGRALFDAKLTLLISGWVSWMVFIPFWKGRSQQYVIIGATLAVLSLCLDTIFEFEGGLLFLWVATLVMHLRTEEVRLKQVAWLLPVGMLIRPDMALPIVVLALGWGWNKGWERFSILTKALVVSSLAVALGWSVIAYMLGVYPIPVTYWAKAAIPLIFEHQYLLGVLPERLGLTLMPNFVLSALFHTIIGWFAIFLWGMLCLSFQPKFGRWWLAISLVLTLIIFSRLPANFWWYYQNIICILMGFGFGVILTRPESFILKFVSTMLTIGAVGVLCIGRLPNRGPNLWQTSVQSRAQGYLSIATLETGRGTVNLPEIGEVIVRSPEIGMMAYFSKKPIFQWDSAGLAQPLEDAKVQESTLRNFYPQSLRVTAAHDAQEVVDRIGKKIQVVDVWAMEDRNYGEARKHCRYVFPQYALCVNPYKTLAPTNHQ